MSRKKLSTKRLKNACDHVCEKNAENFHNLNDKDVVLSDNLLKQVDALLAEGKTKSVKPRRRLKTVLITAAIALLVVIITCMSITAIREKILEALIVNYRNNLTHQFDTLSSDDPSKEFEIMLPTYLPEGYEIAEDYSRSDHLLQKYRNADSGFFLIFGQDKVGSVKRHIDNQNTEIREVNIGSHVGTAILGNDGSNPTCILLWNDGTYEFYLSTKLSLEETIRIAESIR